MKKYILINTILATLFMVIFISWSLLEDKKTGLVMLIGAALVLSVFSMHNNMKNYPKKK